jgi:hypothetical protein
VSSEKIKKIKYFFPIFPAKTGKKANFELILARQQEIPHQLLFFVL